MRDVLTGKAIAGLAMRIPHQVGSARIVLTSVAGDLELAPGESPTAVAVVQHGWVLAEVEAGAAGARTLWLYRLVDLRGRVVASGGSEGVRIQDTRIRVQAPAPQQQAGAPEHAVGSYPWMRARGLDLVRDAVPVESDGRFQMRVPRLAGYFLTAALPFHSPADARLEFAEDEEARDGVELVLGAPLTYSGRLTDQDGNPLGDVEIQCEWTLRGTAESLEHLYQMAQLRGLGTGTIRNRKTGDRELHIQAITRTDASGAFRADLPRLGMSLELVALAPGHRLERVSLADVRDTQHPNVLIAQSYRGESPRCQLTASGTPLVGFEVKAGLVDVSRSLVRSLGPTDASGRFPAEWLESGRAYLLRVVDPSGVAAEYYVRWGNSARLETTELAARPEDLR